MQSDPNWRWVVIFSRFRVACRRPVSPCSDACPSCDALFFCRTDVVSEDNQLEARACKKWPIGKQHTLCHKHSDKVGCFFSPSIPHLKHHFSPYLHHHQPQPSLSSCALRSHSSLMRISLVYKHPLVRPDPATGRVYTSSHLCYRS